MEIESKLLKKTLHDFFSSKTQIKKKKEKKKRGRMRKKNVELL
jgi:hypothetical protein